MEVLDINPKNRGPPPNIQFYMVNKLLYRAKILVGSDKNFPHKNFPGLLIFATIIFRDKFFSTTNLLFYDFLQWEYPKMEIYLMENAYNGSFLCVKVPFEVLEFRTNMGDHPIFSKSSL